MNIEEEIARAIRENFNASRGRDGVSSDVLASRLMPLVERAQAEALREAADEIEITFADHDRRRPLHPKAEVSTDYANDAQWAELIVRNRADRIENEGAGA